jgi:subtilase family serine protease
MRFARLSYCLAAVVAGLAVTVAPAASPAALAAAGRYAGPPDPGSAAGAAANTPGPGLGFRRVSVAPRLPAHVTGLGALPGPTALHLNVTLKIRGQAALTAFIAALSDRRSPQFRHFLTPAEFGARFGATPAQVAAVDAALRAQGLTPGPVRADRLSIPVTTTAAAASRAFGVSLTRYRLAGGRLAYANAQAPRFAASAAATVQGVLGLSTVYRPHSLTSVPVPPARTGGQARRPRPSAVAGTTAAGPQPCTAAQEAAPANDAYTANELASYYGMSPLYGLGDLGAGVRVAIAEFEPDDTADIAAYASCYHLSTAVTYTEVDGGAGTGAGTGEAALDIEDVMGLAPGADIDVYQEPNGGDTDTYDLYSAIINASTPDPVVTTSWGLCELDSDNAELMAEQGLFYQAATQGQTVLASAGDYGSTACYNDGSANGAAISADDPASQPYVIGVGGTTIGTAETVWNDSSVSAGSGGGGLSATWCMPAYQDATAIPGLINSDSQHNAGCTSPTTYLRQVPDVSADADPYTGYLIYYDGGWGGIGGTSAAAPLWAAVAALTDASPFCRYYGSGAAGVQAVGLYGAVAQEHGYVYGAVHEGLNDVTSGTNDYTPSGYSGGLYPATPGYDMASGLGTPLVTGISGSGAVSEFYPGLAALMCWAYSTKLQTTSVTKISPAAGPVNKAATVTLTGTGFLPVAGADHVLAGTKDITASCSSTTRCTVRLPAHAAGTITIRMIVEDLTESPVKSADHVKFVAKPKVTSVSPARGRAGGGNRITIKGSNFTHVTAVYFGKKKGTKITVVSATKITVVVPAGSGTVAVTVHAAGGTSKVVSASHYRY